MLKCVRDGNVTKPSSNGGTNIAPFLVPVHSYCVEYKGIRYTLRIGIERQQWTAAIHPVGVDTSARDFASGVAKRQNDRRAP
jgi:hypothetical protein